MRFFSPHFLRGFTQTVPCPAVEAGEVGYDPDFVSIFNMGVHATSIDVMHVMAAFRVNAHQDWGIFD